MNWLLVNWGGGDLHYLHSHPPPLEAATWYNTALCCLGLITNVWNTFNSIMPCMLVKVRISIVWLCCFNFSQAFVWTLPHCLPYGSPQTHTYTHNTHTDSSWLLWQSPRPPEPCLDPSLTCCHAFPFSSFSFIFLLQLLCEDQMGSHRSNAELFLLSTNLYYACVKRSRLSR